MFDNGEWFVVATSVGAAATVIIIFIWIKRNGTKNVERRYPPASPVLPLFLAIFREGMSIMPERFMRAAEKLGPVISYNVGGRLMVILNGKEAISEAFLRKSEAFADRIDFWTEKNILNRDLRGIAFAKYNDAFKKHHKLCLTILKEFGFGVNSVSETRIHREVESLNEEILSFNGSPFKPKLFTVHATFNVVASILFGEAFVQTGTCHGIPESINHYFESIEYSIDLAPILRFLPSFRRKVFDIKQAHKDMIKGIEEGIECSMSLECESTFVKRFVEIQGPGYDQQDLLYIVRDLCIGSADTVATLLQWALVELANHPEVQSRVQREIHVDEVVPRDRFPSLDDKPRLPYTEAVILEVSRRRTLAPLYLPHATLKDTEVLGFYIPKRCMVIGNAYSAHMDPTIWEDPKNLRPERFLDEDQTIIDSDKESVLAQERSLVDRRPSSFSPVSFSVSISDHQKARTRST